MPSPEVVCSRMMTWPLFSPPRPAPDDLHALEDVLVADRRSDDLAAGRLDGGLEAAVGQDRHDEGPAGQHAALEAIEGEDPEDLVAVDDPTAGVDGDEAVGVTVEGEPDVGAARRDCGRQRCRRGRTGVDVDVDPVGLVVDHLDRGTGRGQDLRTDHPARAVGAVDDEPQPRRVDRARQSKAVLQVAIEQCRRENGPSHLGVAD